MMKAQFVPAWQSGRAQLKAAWSRADLYRLTASVRRVDSVLCRADRLVPLAHRSRRLTPITHQVTHV